MFLMSELDKLKKNLDSFFSFELKKVDSFEFHAKKMYVTCKF